MRSREVEGATSEGSGDAAEEGAASEDERVFEIAQISFVLAAPRCPARVLYVLSACIMQHCGGHAERQYSGSQPVFL